MHEGTTMTGRSGTSDGRERTDRLRNWLERLLIWRVWERMLEIEFLDRSIALAGKAFVSFFPLVIVVAAFVPARTRDSIISALAARLGVQGDAFSLVRSSFASSDDIRKATGALGLALMILFAISFTKALQRVYLRAWRRPPHSGIDSYWRGVTWLFVMLVSLALLGLLRGAAGDGTGIAVWAVAGLVVFVGLWWFTSWWFLLGHVRMRVLAPTGVITGIAMAGYGLSASIWMPEVVTSNEAQFGFFGVALALVTWFSGAAICILVGACAGPVLAEDPGRLGRFIRGNEPGTLNAGAPSELPPPTRDLSLRDAFRTGDDA
jgi:membrane protein